MRTAKDYYLETGDVIVKDGRQYIVLHGGVGVITPRRITGPDVAGLLRAGELHDVSGAAEELGMVGEYYMVGPSEAADVVCLGEQGL